VNELRRAEVEMPSAKDEHPVNEEHEHEIWRASPHARAHSPARSVGERPALSTSRVWQV